MRRANSAGLIVLSCLVGAGCSAILGLDEFTDAQGTGGAAATTSQTSGGGSTSSTTDSTASSGGSGAGGGKVCQPGAMETCPYDGTPGTEGVGPCKAGHRTCNVDGTGYGPCTGEVIDASKDDCATKLDDDCNGQVNDGCPCTPGSSEMCYSGPNGTEGVGICHAGTHTCNQDGLTYGACMDEVTPGTETCNTPDDDDCDGQVNEDGTGCVCVPNSSTTCYTGPAGTAGVGSCKSGTKTCNDQGTAYLPQCSGEVLPGLEDCNAKGDEDCDGFACSETIWAESFQTGDLRKMALDPQGNIILFGTFGSSIQFGNTVLITAGATDLFLAKLQPDGTPLWAKKFGDAGNQIQTSALTVDSSGNITIVAPLSGSIDFGGGPLSPGANMQGFAVAHFGANGAHLWSKAFQSASSLGCAGVAPDPSTGDLVLAGTFSGTVTFGGGNLTTAGANDIFIAKLSAGAGAHVWSKRFGDASGQGVSDISMDSNGNILLTGPHAGVWTFGGPNLNSPAGGIYVARLDPSGNGAASHSIDGGGTPVAIRADSSGALTLLGTFSSPIDLGNGSLTPAGATDIYLAHFTTNCTEVWSKAFGGSANEWDPSLALDPQNDILLGTQTTGTVDFGGGAMTSQGTYDVTFAKLTNAGNHIWSRMYGTSGVDSHMLASSAPGGELVLAFDGSNNVDMGTGPLPAGIVVAKVAP